MRCVEATRLGAGAGVCANTQGSDCRATIAERSHMATPVAAPSRQFPILPLGIVPPAWKKKPVPWPAPVESGLDRKPHPDPTPPQTQNRDELVVKLLPLVRRMAWQMRERLPLHVELDDLISTGVLGLIDAVRKFDARKDVKLERYAQHRVRGAILDGLRGLDTASRDMRRKSKKAETVYRKLETKLGRPPSDGEMAEGLGGGLKAWYRIVLELQAVGMDWLRPMGSVGTREPASWRGSEESLAADNPVDQYEACFRRERREILERALERISERERLVVRLYYDQGLTMKAIGKRLGIDESRVSQLHTAALARLRQRVTGILLHPQPAAPRFLW